MLDFSSWRYQVFEKPSAIVIQREKQNNSCLLDCVFHDNNVCATSQKCSQNSQWYFHFVFVIFSDNENWIKLFRPYKRFNLHWIQTLVQILSLEKQFSCYREWILLLFSKTKLNFIQKCQNYFLNHKFRVCLYTSFLGQICATFSF